MSQPNVRSTIHRRGNTAKPLTDSERLTTSTSSLGQLSLTHCGKALPGVAAVYPELSQLGEPSCDPLQNLLSPVSLRTTGWGHDHAHQQSQGIHQNVPLASADFFAGIKTDRK